jgi:hypothetical protein
MKIYEQWNVLFFIKINDYLFSGLGRIARKFISELPSDDLISSIFWFLAISSLNFDAASCWRSRMHLSLDIRWLRYKRVGKIFENFCPVLKQENLKNFCPVLSVLSLDRFLSYPEGGNFKILKEFIFGGLFFLPIFCYKKCVGAKKN